VHTYQQPPAPVSESYDWQLHGACRGMDVEIFYHPAGERRQVKARRISRAKTICQACPVIDRCAQWALDTLEPYGIWGGLSEDERAAILGVPNLRYPTPRGNPPAAAPGATDRIGRTLQLQ